MIAAVLQARVSSRRLPGKILKPILGVPMILRQIERIRRSRLIDRLVLATSTDQTDDALAELCKKNNVDCFRGSLEDVLDRFYQAARSHSPECVVRLTGDCPLTDPAVIDDTLRFMSEGHFDFATNALECTFPDGLDVEAMRYASLEEAWKNARLPSEREHVTPYLYQHPEHFKIGIFKNKTDLSAWRWTVDEPADFELVEKIYAELYPLNPAFTTADVLAWFDRHPEMRMLNSRFQRNEGYAASRNADAAVKRSS
jgi:spore coat polysaccharide biosynthesis protein SpsF